MTGTGETDDVQSPDGRRWRIPSFAAEELKAAVKIPSAGPKGLALLVGLAGLTWLISGVYKVQPDEQGVVLRFGRWVETTDPGLHYHLPAPISTVLLPKVTKLNQIQLGAADAPEADTGRPATRNQMLTGDENIVEADCVVFWQVKDAGRYLFAVSNPEATLKAIAESSLREVVSQHPIQAALSGQRQLIASQVRELLQQRLDAEGTGIQVSQVQLQRVDPPYQVIDAFNDVQRARADQERARNEAEAYANDILPRARGQVEIINQEASGYKSQVVNLAEGEAKAFAAVYESYARSKDVTAWRLYMESMDEMLKKASKVVIDSSGRNVSGIVPYMPLSDQKDRANGQGGK